MCGSTVRPRATFCHRCGGSVVVSPEKIIEPDATNFSEQPALETQRLEAPSGVLKNQREEANVTTVLSDKQGENNSHHIGETDILPVESNITASSQMLETQANNTDFAKPASRRVIRTTEYVWEESNSDPTWRLVLFVVIAVALVLVIFWLARIIR